VYTDGACIGNPGPGGWAWAVPDGRFASGPQPLTTNQRMEIRAALEAVRALEGPLEVVSDSTYVVNCFRDRWWEGWLERGWRNKAKAPVANRDLWEPLIEAVRADPGRVTFTWVKGHSDDPMNDLVDRLAVDAARRQQGRAGEGMPADLGPPDAPARRPNGDQDALVPAGHLVVVGGHRPPALGGYDDNPVAAGVRGRLAEILAAKATLHPDLMVLSGLGLGAEQLGAEAALEAKVPFFAVLAFPGQDAVWPAGRRRRFEELRAAAAGQVVLQLTTPTDRAGATRALTRRDAWLARHASEALVVWDGDDLAVGRLVRSLRDHLGEEAVWVVGSPASRSERP
jgi:ribonuclease HI